ncbi:MAG: hypothetical protein WKG00_21875 [Polyangiaceae bacterium]
MDKKACLDSGMAALGALVLVAGLAACGGSTPPAEDASIIGDAPTASSPETPAAPAEGEGSGEGASDLNEGQKEQMMIALRRGGEKAANCGQVVADTKTGKGEVEVTFDGKKGRITDVSVGAPWAGTPAEQCIKRSFVGEIVLPFDGDPKAVPYTVEIPDKKAAATPPPKKK